MRLQAQATFPGLPYPVPPPWHGRPPRLAWSGRFPHVPLPASGWFRRELLARPRETPLSWHERASQWLRHRTSCGSRALNTAICLGKNPPAFSNTMPRSRKLRKKPEATGIPPTQPYERSWLLLRKVPGVAIHNVVLGPCARSFSLSLNADVVAGNVLTSVARAIQEINCGKNKEEDRYD